MLSTWYAPLILPNFFIFYLLNILVNELVKIWITYILHYFDAHRFCPYITHIQEGRVLAVCGILKPFKTIFT